jgi:hypothetical protein
MDSWQLGPNKSEVVMEAAKKVFADDKLLSPGLMTKQTFGDCHIHFDMLLASAPGKPAGPGKHAGSGLKTTCPYQIVTQDSYTKLWGDERHCQMMSLYSPGGGKSAMSMHGNVLRADVNYNLPPLTWQGVDVDFTAAKYDNGKKTSPSTLTVEFNGKVLFNKLELSNVKEVPEPSPIEFILGLGVRFRNVWVLPK